MENLTEIGARITAFDLAASADPQGLDAKLQPCGYCGIATYWPLPGPAICQVCAEGRWVCVRCNMEFHAAEFTALCPECQYREERDVDTRRTMAEVAASRHAGIPTSSYRYPLLGGGDG